jgi:argininosuccinate lyase
VDGRLFEEDIEGSKAHVRMLVKQKIIPSADGRAILRALESIRKDIASGKLTPEWGDEDIHTFIEQKVVERIGERGERLHTARSRNDQIALDERLYLRKQIGEMTGAVRALQRALLRQAEKHTETIVPCYTHLQRAQPILLAHHLIAYISMLERDRERFDDCLKRVNRSPLGAAACAGSSLPIDRDAVARSLGFDGIIENSIDAVSDRDVLIEFISACAITMMHLSRLAEEIVLWCTTEFGIADIDDAYATGSSLMPQKKNPDIAELIRGKTGRVYGDLLALLTVMKGLPLAYNRDLQEDKPALFDAADTARASLLLAAELVTHLRLKGRGMGGEREQDYSHATDIVEYLVKKGIPFRTAHRIVGRLVAYCVEKGRSIASLSADDVRRFSPHLDATFLASLTPALSVRRKQSAGSTSPREVQRQLRRWKRYLQKKGGG